MSQLSASSSSFRLPEPAPKRHPQWPALICVAAITMTAVITLVPAAGEEWSRRGYPVLAKADGYLNQVGWTILPATESSMFELSPIGAPQLTEAVVLGPISMSSEDTPAATRNTSDPPAKVAGAIVRPVGWITRIPEAPSEADELLH